jgi:hypothetical protein
VTMATLSCKSFILLIISEGQGKILHGKANRNEYQARQWPHC